MSLAVFSTSFAYLLPSVYSPQHYELTLVSHRTEITANWNDEINVKSYYSFCQSKNMEDTIYITFLIPTYIYHHLGGLIGGCTNVVIIEHKNNKIDTIKYELITGNELNTLIKKDYTYSSVLQAYTQKAIKWSTKIINTYSFTIDYTSKWEKRPPSHKIFDFDWEANNLWCGLGKSVVIVKFNPSNVPYPILFAKPFPYYYNKDSLCWKFSGYYYTPAPNIIRIGIQGDYTKIHFDDDLFKPTIMSNPVSNYKVVDGLKNKVFDKVEILFNNGYDGNKKFYNISYSLYEPPYVMQNKVGYRELNSLLDTCIYLRNEIYARHGYIFKDSTLKSLFERESWYRPNPKFNPKDLNSIEWRNIRYLNELEKIIKNFSISDVKADSIYLGSEGEFWWSYYWKYPDDLIKLLDNWQEKYWGKPDD